VSLVGTSFIFFLNGVLDNTRSLLARVASRPRRRRRDRVVEAIEAKIEKAVSRATRAEAMDEVSARSAGIAPSRQRSSQQASRRHTRGSLFTAVALTIAFSVLVSAFNALSH
jgi:hypothetical protein